MKYLLSLENFGKLMISYLASFWIGFDWWVFLACILLPDLSMIGYIINTKIGAITYNLAHHQGIAILVFILGYYLQNDWTMFSGLVLFGHSAMDRIFGYGLKYPDSFQHTHLGWMKPPK